MNFIYKKLNYAKKLSWGRVRHHVIVWGVKSYKMANNYATIYNILVCFDQKYLRKGFIPP